MSPSKRARRGKASTNGAAVGVSATGSEFDEARLALAEQLLATCYDNQLDRAKVLLEKGADAWVQDRHGWTALHAAAYAGNKDLIELLLRKGNAVWNIVDNIGATAGDVAFSMNHREAYEFMLQEGVRSEMLKAVLEAVKEPTEEAMEVDGAVAKSTAADNATFLASKLEFKTDEDGQAVCLDAEGNGVMMGWESEIMRRTAAELCPATTAREEGDEFAVLNVGFGLGLVDKALQSFKPTRHVIIEPHPDVLAYARSKGWYDLPGVDIFEGTWQQYFAALEEGKRDYEVFDAVYFDTYSEHYADLHAFFDRTLDLLRDPESRFSFFHGLGATSRLFYDVYTQVAEMHLRDVGLQTRWVDVPVSNGEGTWMATAQGKKYWDVPADYRLPVCTMLQ